VVAAMNVLVDITERKKAESQLLRAQRMESIGTLAGGVAHDLNNILSPILMCVSLLKQDLPIEQRDKIIETIEMSAERGADIVKQVLAFGRGLDTRQIRLNVSHVIRDIAKIAGRTFPKDIRLEATMAPDLWPITADATQLHQVLLNLCVNARDAMPSGGSLRINAENLELDVSYASMTPGARPGRHILLTVSDTGTGIPPELIDSIFDPFFTTKPIGKGTGLGLPTVLGIVKSHGGFLQVQSEPGKGTSFKIFLPANQDDANGEVEEKEPEPTPEGQGELILLVDDENAVRLAGRAVLEANGYRVVVAADGVEALTVCAQNAGQIRLVLTDVVMPFMDGPALVRALGRMGLNAPIIATTGDGAKGRLTELQTLGVTNILRKPYSAESLLRALHAALHPAGSTPPPA
jgi:nitrogen-specific signal transduction histidine kinase/ActR/RegA family two-component response regulator